MVMKRFNEKIEPARHNTVLSVYSSKIFKVPFFSVDFAGKNIYFPRNPEYTSFESVCKKTFNPTATSARETTGPGDEAEQYLPTNSSFMSL